MLTLGGDGRLDVAVDNEATAFALTSRAFVDTREECARVAARGTRWQRAIDEGRFLPVGLRQDDSFVVRIVTGDLRPQELDEWVGRIEATLDLPDGLLVISGGLDFLDDDNSLDDSESLRVINVPPGRYVAAIYSYLSGVNGELDLPAAEGGENVGDWFRRTRPDKAMPAWLKRWQNYAPLDAQDECVDFVVHLHRYEERARLPLRLEHRLLWAADRRRPERCPLGLAVENVVRQAASDRAPQPLVKADVLSRVADATPRRFRGKPISHAAADLWQIYRIPFACNDSVNCEITVDLPDEESATAIPNTATAVFERAGERLRIGFPRTGGRWDLMRWLKELRAPLSVLREASQLEMVFADEGNSEEGRQRWAGPVRDGVWEIEATWPPVGRPVAADAVAFCRSVDDEADGVKVRNADEAAAILDRIKGDSLFVSHPVRRRGLRLIPDDPDLLQEQLAIHVFQHRYGGTWPFNPAVEDDAAAIKVGPVTVASPHFRVEMQALLASARSADIVFEGSCSRYRSKDLGHMGPGMKAVFEPLDDEAGSFGWEPLGNLLCDLQPGVLMRAYSAAEATLVLMVYCTATGLLGKDLFTRFHDGSSLTTTNMPGLSRDEPDKKIYRNRLAADSVMELGRAHRRGVGEHLRTRKVRVLPAPRTTADLAREIDEFLTRSMGV